jgi:hypothetical protein
VVIIVLGYEWIKKEIIGAVNLMRFLIMEVLNYGSNHIFSSVIGVKRLIDIIINLQITFLKLILTKPKYISSVVIVAGIVYVIFEEYLEEEKV